MFFLKREEIHYRMMMKAKSLKPTKEWHSSNKKFGMGDYYGTGIKQKVGRIREGYGQNPITPAKLKKPPKSLA